MTVSSQLLQASFRGVEFFISSETNRSGRKTVTHEYPNSPNRLVEDLGALPNTFTFRAFVHGNDALQKRDLLIRALDEKGEGLLVHPYYGSVEVVSDPYEVSTSDTELGKVNFSLTFKRTSLTPLDEPNTSTLSAVSDLADQFRQQLIADLEALFQKPTSIQNALDADSKINSIGTILNSSVPTTLEDDQIGSAFKQAVQDIIENPSRYAANPDLLAEKFQDIFDNMVALASTDILLDVYLDLTNFGDDDLPITLDTALRILRQKNRSVLNAQIKMQAIIGAYEQACAKEYTTVNELTDVITRLEDAFEHVLETFDGENIEALRPRINTIYQIRVNAKNVLDQKRQQAFSVVEKNTNQVPASVFVYSLYGSVENLDVVKNLNPNQNHSRLNKTAQAVTR